MTMLPLVSGEEARVEIIPRKEAIEILSKPARRQTWFGEKYRSAHRTSRGPGSAIDLLNIGLRVKGKCRAVMRFGNAPWRNKPVIAAVGPELANRSIYLMRLWGSGIASDDLVAFIKAANLLFPREIQRRHPDWPTYHYMVSLDSISGWLIDQPRQGIFEEAPPAAGRIYHKAGALYAGQTKSKSQPTRYIEPGTERIRSVYNGGRNFITELSRREEVQLINDGPKHRFVFILAPEDSLEYQAYRKALPVWVNDFEWGDQGLGWIQPRLLIRQLFNRSWPAMPFASSPEAAPS